MANINFKIEPTSQTMIQLAKGVKKEGSRIWAGRMLAHATAIRKDIGTMLVKIFNETPVAKAIRGQGGEDLPAHFGLSDSMANALADGMAELIRSSVKLISKSASNNTVFIRIQAVEDDWNDYLGLPGAQYISYPSNITIPVVKWLLVDPSIDVGAGAYDIVFKGEDTKFDVRIQDVSRSGRAIMVSLQALGGGGGYVLPAIVSGQAGKNFIEMTLGQPNVAMEATQILMKRVR